MCTNLGDPSPLLSLVQRLDLLLCLIRIERRSELRAIGESPAKIMANQMDGILILSWSPRIELLASVGCG